MHGTLTRADLIGHRIVWLLDLSFAGRDFRLSTEPVIVVDEDGNDLPYDGSLLSLSFTESFARLEISEEGATASVEVDLPVDVALLRRQGHPLTGNAASLSIVTIEDHAAIHGARVPTAAQSIDSRKRMLEGWVSRARYADPDEGTGWAEFEIERPPWTAETPLIPVDARITADTWSDAFDESFGKVYPIVFGTPGLYTTSGGTSGAAIPATPAYVVEKTGANADTLLIAGHPVDATTVSVWDVDTLTQNTVNVTNQVDGLGRLCATVDVSGLGGGVRASTEWWVTWDTSTGALQSPFAASTYIDGAGSLCRWILQQSELEIDYARWRAAATYLDRYKVAGYINDPEVTAWTWLVDNVLPLLPVAIINGPHGVYPLVHDPETGVNEAVAVITEGPAFRRTTAMIEDTAASSVRNRITLKYAVNGQDGEPKRNTVITPDPDSTDNEQYGGYYAKLSYDRYGILAEEARTSEIVYDEATALLILHHLERTAALVPMEADFVAGPEWTFLELNDHIDLTDADAQITNVAAQVVARTWDGEEWTYTLILDPDPPREPREVS